MSTVSIVRCRTGGRGKIVELDTQDCTILGKLMSLGIVPGAHVRIMRSRPGVLLQVGHTKVALDRGLAAYILLEPIL
jgi:Fe2+ transport system protein FeoA